MIVALVNTDLTGLRRPDRPCRNRIVMGLESGRGAAGVPLTGKRAPKSQQRPLKVEPGGAQRAPDGEAQGAQRAPIVGLSGALVPRAPIAGIQGARGPPGPDCRRAKASNSAAGAKLGPGQLKTTVHRSPY
jgi:hypothetical protein